MYIDNDVNTQRHTKMPKRQAKLTILANEVFHNQNTVGCYWVERFEDGECLGGNFFETEKEARAYMLDFETYNDLLD
jgi:hypothetical protein